MSKDLPKDNKFCIAFTTDAVAATGVVKTIEVTLQEGTLAPEESAHINLCEHPLYQKLRNYCIKNKPR